MPYFDHNATTPLAPVAREAWLQASAETWHNPSSPYRDSARAKIRLDAARARLAEFLGCAPELVVFTSGATEGANAVLAHWSRTLPADARVAINPTEHPCVLEPARLFLGERLLWLPVTRDGVVDCDALQTLLKNNRVGGVIVMAANNETGVLQPWTELARLCSAAGVGYFCDAVQWFGKLPASGLGAAGWVIGSAHKFGGPKGVGFLKLPVGAESFHAQVGGAQQRGHRGGTEDLPGVAALVAALTEAEERKVFQESERVRWREQFEQTIRSTIPSVVVVGAGAERLWNTVSLLMPHTENHRWVMRLDKAGFQVSTGSACATAKQGPSHVLAALGYSPDEAKRVIRISSGWETTETDWNSLALALAGLEAEFRADKGSVIQII
jgi:cysteine desulfurase